VLSRSLAIALTLAAFAWVGALVVAPLAFSRHGPSSLVAAVYAGGSMVCNQRPERSFAISGAQMPVCARCSGLYVAGAVGALAGWIIGARRVQGGSRGVRIALALAAAPTALTWAAEWVGVSHPSNVTRAVAALPLGAAAGWIFVRMLVAESRSTATNPDMIP
jgi:uncharacterized membrane protein